MHLQNALLADFGESLQKAVVDDIARVMTSMEASARRRSAAEKS